MTCKTVELPGFEYVIVCSRGQPGVDFCPEHARAAAERLQQVGQYDR
jgi:hypothetical protein